MTEDQLQAAFWKHVWNAYPAIRRHIWAVPNAGQRNPVEASKLKATGLLEGVWDIHIFWNNQFYIIETKVGKNQLTVDRTTMHNGKPRKHYGQKQWGEMMVAHGAKSFIYRTLEEGIAIIEKILSS